MGQFPIESIAMDYYMDHAFTVEHPLGKLVGDVWGPEPQTSLLMLHGAGTASRVRFSPLRQALFSRGVSTCTFDFIGCGGSGGDLGQTSLDSRCEQAGMVIDDQGLKSPLALLGASMGAYTAIKLLEQYDVAHLILIVPAVYTPRAADVPFGEAFSRIIRAERSWAESDAWGILAEYTGNLLIVAAENDAVIPQEIIQRLHDSAVCTRHRHILTIPRAPHHILSYLTTIGADWLDSIAAHIASCLNPASDRTGAAT